MRNINKIDLRYRNSAFEKSIWKILIMLLSWKKISILI